MKAIHSKSKGGHLLNIGGVCKPRKSRGRGLRTKNGCKACRDGHVKCDEVHPRCGRCRKTDRSCSYTPNLSNANADQQESQVSVASSYGCLSRRCSSQASFSSNAVLDSWITACMPFNERLWSPSLHSDYGTDSASSSSLNLTADACSGDMLNISSVDLHQRDSPWRYSCLNRDSSPLTQLHTTGICPTSLVCHKFPVEGTCEELQLTAEDRDCYRQYINGIGQWIDLFDPEKRFSSLVPQSAKRDMGLMKAILALGAHQLSSKEGPHLHGFSSLQYRTQAEDYLREAMKRPHPERSSENLDTILLLSQHQELASGVAKGYENRMREIFKAQAAGQVGSIPLATSQAWLRLEVWAAFRERRKCVSIFKPSKLAPEMDIWDRASMVVSILAQSIDYRSDQERKRGEEHRVSRGNKLMGKLDSWFSKKTVRFDPLPVDEPSAEPFQRLTMNPPAFGNSIQMYCVAKIFILATRPVVGDMREGSEISDCIDTIVGIALNLKDAANIVASVQCVFMAGRYCSSEPKRRVIEGLLNRHQTLVDWPPKSINLSEELRAEWLEMDRVSVSTQV